MGTWPNFDEIAFVDMGVCFPGYLKACLTKSGLGSQVVHVTGSFANYG